MSIKRRKFTSEFKARVALDAIRGDLTINEIAAKHGVHASQIAKWKQKALSYIKSGFTDKKKNLVASDQQLTEKLYQQIGQMKVELDFLKKSEWE